MLRSEDSRLDARERLARELHDEISHRVSTISLQVMGHRTSDDVASLRRAMDNIAASAADVLAHLWLLDRVLRAHPYDASAAPSPELRHLSVCEPVVAMVEVWASTLREAGFAVDVATPGASLHVGPLARRTVEEALRVAREVVVPLGDRREVCSVEVETSPGSVALKVRACLDASSAVELADEALARGPALHERVRLTEGTLWMDEPGRRTWSLVLRLRDR